MVVTFVVPPWVVVRQVSEVYVQKKRVRSVLDESEPDHCNQRCISVLRVRSDMVSNAALWCAEYPQVNELERPKLGAVCKLHVPIIPSPSA